MSERVGAGRRRDLLCVATTRTGLEGVLEAELRSLGLATGEVQPGAVPFHAPTRGLYLAVRRLRTATRVLLVAGSLRARTFGLLERGLFEVDWASTIPEGHPVRVRVRSKQSRLYHTSAVAERVEAAIRDATGDPDHGDASAPLLVDVRLVEDRAEIRIDASGETLDRRGWRLATAKAPLPPTVAAAALLGVGWGGTQPLLDPMCGSGTIAIEGALLAWGRPPGQGRDYAVQSWASFAPGTWASVAAAPGPTEAPARIHASDRDPGAVEATTGNAARAGVADLVVVEGAPLAAAADHVDPGAGPGWIVTNPPWGERLGAGSGDLRNLYAALGQLTRRLPGWHLALLTAAPELARATGLPMAPRWRTRAGGQPVTLFASE